VALAPAATVTLFAAQTDEGFWITSGIH